MGRGVGPCFKWDSGSNQVGDLPSSIQDSKYPWGYSCPGFLELPKDFPLGSWSYTETFKGYLLLLQWKDWMTLQSPVRKKNPQESWAQQWKVNLMRRVRTAITGLPDMKNLSSEFLFPRHFTGAHFTVYDPILCIYHIWPF